MRWIFRNKFGAAISCHFYYSRISCHLLAYRSEPRSVAIWHCFMLCLENENHLHKPYTILRLYTDTYPHTHTHRMFSVSLVSLIHVLHLLKLNIFKNASLNEQYALIYSNEPHTSIKTTHLSHTGCTLSLARKTMAAM